MKKHILALAVASVAATPAFADSSKKSETNFYGNIQYAVEYSEREGGMFPSDPGFDSYDNGSTLGLTHKHEIAPGFTGFAKVEFHDMGLNDNGIQSMGPNDNESSEGISGLDEAYIGVAGDFGKVWVGTDESIYTTLIQRLPDYYESGRHNIWTGGDTGQGDLLQYSSPYLNSFGDGVMQFYGALGFENERDDMGEKQTHLPYQLGFRYLNGSFMLNAAMDSNDGAERGNENVYGINAEIAATNQIVVGATYNRQDSGADPQDRGSQRFDVYGRYTIGKSVYAVSYEREDTKGLTTTYDMYGNTTHSRTGDETNETITLQAKHHVSESISVFSEAYFQTTNNESWGESESTSVVFGGKYAF